MRLGAETAFSTIDHSCVDNRWSSLMCHPSPPTCAEVAVTVAVNYAIRGPSPQSCSTSVLVNGGIQGAKQPRSPCRFQTYYVLAGQTPVLVHNCGTTDFYTVQGADDAARLRAGGSPFPTAPERAHFGPGVYAWGNEADAAAYAANKSGVEVMKFTIDNKALAGLKQAHLGQMTDDAATAFMEKNSLLWGGDAGHGLDYISRATAKGTEHFFSSNVFHLLGFG